MTRIPREGFRKDLEDLKITSQADPQHRQPTIIKKTKPKNNYKKQQTLGQGENLISRVTTLLDSMPSF